MRPIFWLILVGEFRRQIPDSHRNEIGPCFWELALAFPNKPTGPRARRQLAGAHGLHHRPASANLRVLASLVKDGKHVFTGVVRDITPASAWNDT
jgi:hypothetical protein